MQMDKHRAAVHLETSFPTGNGVVVAHNDEIVLDRDMRDSTGDRWYWHVRFTAARDTVVRVRLARPRLIGRFGPTVRTGNDYHWLWSAAGPDDAFELQVEAGASVHASATIPYGSEELTVFRGRMRDALRWSVLTVSDAGYEVPVARVHAPRARRMILLTARHHACEATASFVMEGAIEQFIGLRREGASLARDCELVAVPLVDVDGVHEGDQGKARMPWDHNRDYAEASRYRAVGALRAMMARERRAIYALDLHTPGLRGDIEERPYVVASADTGDREAATELLARLNAADINGARSAAGLLEFDQGWNSSSSRGPRCCAAWLRSLRATRLATTIEYPNAVDCGQPISPEDARGFGANLMCSLLAMVE